MQECWGATALPLGLVKRRQCETLVTEGQRESAGGSVESNGFGRRKEWMEGGKPYQ